MNQPTNVYKITALYLRLSREDEVKENTKDSNSISNQRAYLTDFAKRHKFKNIQIFIDDGVSGVTMKRNGFQELMQLVEHHEVGTIIVKDMSRLGRNYIEVGQLMDIVFPRYDVRLIAVNDGVDSANGEDDFAPFRNIINELYAKDISRKVRSALKAKSQQGYAIGSAPYGYKYDPKNPKAWIVDEEAAAVVRKIFALRKKGESLPNIAQIISNDYVLTPSYYANKKGSSKPSTLSQYGEYFWDKNVVTRILKNESYTGDVINFRTYSKSYKLKDRIENPREKWEIHRGVHEAIVSRDDFEIVQRSFSKSSTRKPKRCEKNMFAGFLFCGDCGATMHYKYTAYNPDNHYFSCRNYKSNNGLCKTTHHIRVDNLMQAVTDDLFRIIRFAAAYEDEFVRFIMDANFEEKKENLRKHKESLQQAQTRYREIDVVYGSIYEDKVVGNISKDRFLKLSQQLEEEQEHLGIKIESLNEAVNTQMQSERDADKFLVMVRKYINMNELSLEIIQEFIEKIVVFHREEINGVKHQKIQIHYRMLGHIDIPHLTEQEHEACAKIFGLKEKKTA